MKKNICLLIAAVLIPLAAAAPVLAQADDPVAFGRQAVAESLAARGLQVPFEIRVSGEGLPESYAIRFAGGKAIIEAPDQNGALYGALELAERITRRGGAALAGAPITGRPFLRDRGWNLFLTLPWSDAAADTDYDPLALTDPARWWFANDDFWQTLFDQMARARLNWLDLHGTWDISITDAPNLYAYFIQSENFPKVGVAPEIKEANLKQLNKIIRMAHARGVRVSLMAYEARFHTPHAPAPYPEKESDLYAYTREVVEKMIRQAAELDAIGFRIGESGHGEAFFNSYIEAVKASGRDIPLVTRSWLARKAKVVPLAAASRDFTVEIKFNGEQWGAPFLLMGGRMAGWYSYSFEDYLSDSGTPEAERLWPGNPAAGGGTWPAQPYKIVWQVRANGTHRILPVYNPEFVRRAIRSMPLGTAGGFVVEGLETYYPKSPSYYLARPEDGYVPWIHERDWMYLNLWGRLGYDPSTPDDRFDALIADKLGAAAPPLAKAWKAASRIVSTAFSAFSLGPDHRNHAVELEWGGDTRAFLEAEPFDTHVFSSIRGALSAAAGQTADGRVLPQVTAARLMADADLAAKAARIAAASAPEKERKRLKELTAACVQAGHLGRYYAERLLSAWRYGQGEVGVAGAAGKAAFHMRKAAEEWEALAACPYYKPFTERLRMRTNAFHWSLELPKVKAEAERLEKLAPPVADPMAPLPAEPRAPALSLSIEGDSATLSIPAAGINRAWALVKPLPSSAFFHKVPMTLRAKAFEFKWERELWGHAVAAEIESGGRIRRLPGWDADAPYLIVSSLAGPAPLLYSSEEALAYLDPSILSPSEHGLLLISSRAGNFFRGFNPALQRKLLDPVSRGLTLIVLAQSYAAGRYTLDWLPKPLRTESRSARVFDPAGTLGLPKIEAEDILRQAFLPGSDWIVPGNGSMAVLPWGRGRVVLVNGRLLERLHMPGCAEALAKILNLGGAEKPVVVVDAGTEGGAYTSSAVTDFMNARGISFLTLGEVIGRAQGASAAMPIPGRLDDDDVLSAENIRPERMLRTFLEKKVKAAAALAAPADLQTFEDRRDIGRRELLRCLGLDPLPPRTPLNARVTGILRRSGYRIEKIVFESRPGFPITAHLYVPESPVHSKFPVIVNPHGHWGYKKNEPTVQARLIGQVLAGYLAIVVDSPGFSFEGDRRVERRTAGTHDDLRLILGSQNATSVYVWDLSRALDYLATRPEADMERIGLTGASGGGLATMWAFAAEPRFTCAVSVVYASSMEVNPHNGCLCNHVPGSLRLGDRADVLALRAPAPLLIIGAEDDSEFPAEGMRLTGEKIGRLWGFFGKSGDAWTRIFPGGHDYSRPMRETAMGFFDKYLRETGDGSPVPERAFETEPPESPELFVLPDPPEKAQTMRDIARAMFDRTADSGSADDYIEINGGLPAAAPPQPRLVDVEEGKARFLITSETGLTLPAIYWPPKSDVLAYAVLITEKGKADAAAEFGVEKLLEAGIACLVLDPRGVGELKDLDLRLTTYLGQAPAFGMGWDIARSIAALVPKDAKVAVVGRGPAAGQAALAAGLIDPRIGFIAGLQTIKEYADAFREDVPLLAIQPRANYAPPLSRLRRWLEADSLWSFLGEDEPDWAKALIRWAER